MAARYTAEIGGEASPPVANGANQLGIADA
jgi:hypothetical protein